MKTVWKYKITLNSSLCIRASEDAKVVLVAEQFPGELLGNGQLTLWIEQDPDNSPLYTRTFKVFGTGQEIPDEADHVGSVLTENGNLIWHVFEVQG